MSTNIGWIPAPKNNYEVLSKELKHALNKRFTYSVDISLTSLDRSYLEGLADAGIDDAQTLIDAISKYGNILVAEF